MTSVRSGPQPSAVGNKQGTGPAIPELEGRSAYPRRNGEPVFDAPWQSRAFGMVVTLHNQGVYPWDDFKERLITEVGTAGCTTEAGGPGYYEHFLNAFWRLLHEQQLLTEQEMLERTEQFRTGARREVY